VELMIVVAVIGVLAALAYYGLTSYLAAAKASEAKQIVGDMARSAYSSYQRELGPSQTVAEGSQSINLTHRLCNSATPVPLVSPPAARKYQPNTTPGQDFHTGGPEAGWLCLRFIVSTPIYHQYHYTKDAGPVAASSPVACTANCFEAGALGDLDGDGVLSRVARTGHINTTTGELKASTTIHAENESE
jgi:type IV pilus assembly protein PilA